MKKSDDSAVAYSAVEKRGAIFPDIFSEKGENQYFVKYSDGAKMFYDEIRCDGGRGEVLNAVKKVLDNWPGPEWDAGHFQVTFTINVKLKEAADEDK